MQEPTQRLRLHGPVHNKLGGPFFGGPQGFAETTALLRSDGFLVDDATYSA